MAFAHIDCDWYEAVKFCLDRLAYVLSPRGIIVLDDYHAYGGCRVAVAEFLAKHPDFRLEDGASPFLFVALLTSRAESELEVGAFAASIRQHWHAGIALIVSDSTIVNFV